MDLNSDVGEGFGVYTQGDDEALLAVVTSANVACGFHAGDPRVMSRTVAAAIERGVAIGAQVSYPDLVGFGRRPIAATPDEITSDVLYQIGALEAIARSKGGRVRYVKPHGALYNAAATDEAVAEAVVAAVAAYDPALPVLTLPGSAVVKAAARLGVPTVAECFADRAYAADGSLVPRGRAGAVITDPDVVVARAVRMATERVAAADDGKLIEIGAVSMCVHGDTPGAAELARRIREALDAAGVVIKAFT